MEGMHDFGPCFGAEIMHTLKYITKNHAYL